MYRVLIRLLTFQFVIIQILFKSKNNFDSFLANHSYYQEVAICKGMISFLIFFIFCVAILRS
jgi:hypothetical protein